MPARLIPTAFLAALVCGSSLAYAQETGLPAALRIEQTEKFSALGKIRSDILRAIPKARDDLATLESRKTTLENDESNLFWEKENLELSDYSIDKENAAQSKEPIEAELQRIDAQLEEAQSQAPPNEVLIEQLSDKRFGAQNELSDINRRLLELDVRDRRDKEKLSRIERRLIGIDADKGEVQDAIDLQNAEIARLLQQQFEVEDKINRKLIPQTQEQDFKTLIAVVFACLVGIVILGFFYIARLDETVRQAIFSGESGIQFITLFSLVIAIILFGITGILEDKELAA